ncbi:MAG: hypothetical protein PHU56_01820 [Candidatus Pacebacteria bacterium]|nr:hypothetical protein [Candidatus Paceibacterota bacterium]
MLTRRDFLKALMIMTASFAVKGCINPEPPDIILTGDDNDANNIAKLYTRLKSLVENPDDHLRIGFMDKDGEVGVLDFYCVQDSAGEKHIAFLNENTFESATLYFGWKGISPSIRFADDSGDALRDSNGQEMEYALWHLGDRAPALAVDWFKLGIVAAAAGLAIFLGAKIIGLVIAAIAFIAYYAMILALVVAAVALLSRGAKWLVEKTGWNMESVRDFFGKETGEIRELIKAAKPF